MLSAMRTSDIASTPDTGDALSVAANVKGIGSVSDGNGAGPLFCCPDCAYKTTSLRKLGRHRSVNHAGVKYRCEHCDFVTGYQSNYYRHRKQVHNGGMSQSALQAVATNSPPQQQTPNRQTSNPFRGGNTLPTLTPAFPMSEDHQRLLAAAIMASSAAPLRCDRCPFQATTADQLAAHISLLHGTDGQRTCGECGITLATKSQWQEHLRTYHSHRNQSQALFSKNDYATIFSSLANNGAAALTAAHLLMAAAANGSAGNGYDLNLLASAAALSSADSLVHQQQLHQARSPEQTKALDLGTGMMAECENDIEKNCQRYYACVYDCDFAARSSRQYLHHLRDEHGEKFAIFYCDQCDDYATKFVARLRRHKALVHDGDKSVLVGNGDEKQKSEENGSFKCGDMKSRNGIGMEDDESDDIADRKLSIVMDQDKVIEGGLGEEEMDGVFRCMHCPYATNELPRFKKHAKCHETTVDTRCQFCNFRTVYSWNLDRHVRCHRQMGKYTCRRCSFSQNTRQSMQFHLVHHHDDVRFVSVETQTDSDEETWEPKVDVGFEPFIFEKHAVRINTGVEVGNGKGNAALEDEDVAEGGFSEGTPVDYSNGQSPFDHSQTPENGRHSAPTPPALLTNGASAILQQNHRQQMFHNRMHQKRRQQQHVQSPSVQSPSVIDVAGRRMKKFLSEQEAIEIPSDTITNEFDNDPDIKNRHCSICGYQGKWISEMIRHKRVHTNERPFKCKYCSRTSKWKADLIRHVAKVHGYRVVSKYSRSKTFDDADQTALKAMKEAVQSTTPPTIPGYVKNRNAFSASPAIGKQDQSLMNMEDMEFEEYEGEEGLDLSNSTEERKATVEKWPINDSFSGQEQDEMLDVDQLDQDKESEREAPTSGINGNHQRSSVEAAAFMFRQIYGGVQLSESTMSNGSSSPASSVLSTSMAKEVRDIIGSKQLTGALEKYVMIKQADGGEPILKCRVCPYETKDLHTFRAHTQKHENKKPYLCSTCGYRSNWSSDVHKHIRLKKTGHETAYVIKLNESELPALPSGHYGEMASPAIVGRSSSNSDCSSNDNGLNSAADAPNRSTIMDTPSPGVDVRSIGQVAWRCLKCDFENESRSMVIQHLNQVHQTPPFACRHCDFISLHRKSCIYHAQSQHNSRDSSIVENLVCEYRSRAIKESVDDRLPSEHQEGEDRTVKRKIQGQGLAFGASPKMDDGNESPNGSAMDQAAMAMMANAAAAAFAASAFGGNGQTKPVDWMQLAQLCFMGGFPVNTGSSLTLETSTKSEEKSGNGESSLTSAEMSYHCDKCPFVGRTESDFVIHGRGHRAPNKGLMCYKCVFCEWYAPKKQSIFEHLKLHTDQPGLYKAEVEKNMITPLSMKRAADDSAESAAANALLGLAKAEKPLNGDVKIMKPENGKEQSENGNFSFVSESKRRKPNPLKTAGASGQRNGESVFLGSSDVDDVMSDFNAIIHAADQDWTQDPAERTVTNGKGHNGTAAIGVGRQSFANTILAASEKLWARKKLCNGSQSGTESLGESPEQFGASMDVESKPLDREAYIHAGEDAFDSMTRLGEVTKGEIQKVTAVVDGQVRKMWQCRHCPHMSKRRANVRMHEKKHFKSSAIGVFKCPKCNYRGDKRSLHVHYRVHMSSENGGSATMPELFQCTNCPAIFQSQEDLALHLTNHNSNSSKAYRCARCSYAVSSPSALQKHARVHDRQSFNSGESPGASSDSKRQTGWNRRYANSAAIANVIVQHEEINSRGDNCDGKSETALNLITRHLNGSKAETAQSRTSSSAQSTPSPTLVDASGGASAFAASLLQPMMKPKKYLCTRCPAKFADRTQLNRHVQFHGVKLKFKCYMCDYSVPFPINLTKHLKSHHNVDIGDVSTAASISDNENESEVAISAGENGDADEGSATSEFEEEGMEDKDEDDEDPIDEDKVGADGGLKIKINLGALKPSSSVA